MLYPADEGQKPETVVQGLHLLSFGTEHLLFSFICICTYMYVHVCCYVWMDEKRQFVPYQ